ncbi:EAL domain-containing protein [Pseudomonas sp. EMN2]|uniref:EAL domain-containing protein n=1 Tax=Pseudomonas sp. EMN2 TaxID=2615212 RepID=UPI00129A26D0|nr:EAL domain-containing protein [Pseudomonas sp. EMN2]
MITKSRHRNLRIKFAVFLAFIAPALVSIPYIEYESRAMQEIGTLKIGKVILDQSELILDQVIFNLQRHEPLHTTPCTEWARKVRILPYLRSVFVFDGNEIICTSIADNIHPDTIDYFKTHSDTKNVFSIDPGTPLSPNNAVVRYQTTTSEGLKIIGFIDSRYFKDLLYTPAWEGAENIIFNLNSKHLSSNDTYIIDSNLTNFYSVASERYPLKIDVYPAASAVGNYRKDLLLRWAPWMIILGGILSLLVNRDLKHRTSIKSEFASALAEDEFFVCYQPIVNSVTGECVGVEALLRWEHPLQGLIPPDLFIPQAENCSMIDDLTLRLFKCIKNDVANTFLPKEFHLAINISADSLKSPVLISRLMELYDSLKKIDIDIVIEITERQMANNDIITQEAMQRLRKLGIRIAIDDFGTGQSSLAYLQTFALDHLKIDRFFVATVDYPSVNAPVLDAIIELGKRLGLKLIAEGVENETQAEYMRVRGVEYLQGYRYARPMQWEAFECWFKSRFYS